MSLSADDSEPCTRLSQSLSSHKKRKTLSEFYSLTQKTIDSESRKKCCSIWLDDLFILDVAPFLEIGPQHVLQKETILKTPETNELSICTGKQLQHLINFTARKIFFSSLILSSSYCYAFV